jgi:hypothetical protein
MVVAVIATGVCSPLAADPAASGRVQNELHQELAGATITVQSLSSPQTRFSTKTDRAGNYVFQVLPDGDFSFAATADGYIGATYSPIKVRYPSRESRDFVLPLAIYESNAIEVNVRLVGTLLISGKPFVHSAVCVYREPIKRCTETNEIGQYQLNIEPGVYRAWVSNDEGIVWTNSLEFPQSGTYDDPIQISGSGRTAGRVK